MRRLTVFLVSIFGLVSVSASGLAAPKGYVCTSNCGPGTGSAHKNSTFSPPGGSSGGSSTVSVTTKVVSVSPASIVKSVSVSASVSTPTVPVPIVVVIRQAPVVVKVLTPTTQSPYYQRSQVADAGAVPVSSEVIARSGILAEFSGLAPSVILNGVTFYLQTPLNPPKPGDQIGVYIAGGGYCIVSASFIKPIGPDRCADIEAEALRQRTIRSVN
jgi:hypothetical protein